ncbi:MAG: DNA invertase Pin-like site-specific DNA recombinase [Flavobacteriaceae bacterium]|jgi:DNA invertase Pin-like site-specific DNA recombinase
MKLARYRRVSSKKQVRKGESLQGQVLKTDVWAKHNDHVIIKDYVDEGVSGWKGTRRAYDQLLEDIIDPTNEIEGVIVYSISRISRNLLVLLTAVQLFEEHNISFFSATENLPQDRSSNRLMIAITGAVSQNQSDVNAVYVKDRLNETAEQGYFTGGRVPFGYTTIEVRDNNKKKKRKKLNVFEEEASTILKIFELCVHGTSGKGYGLKAIATYLNQAGFTHRGNKWTITSLGRLLHDTTYIGQRLYGKNRLLTSNSDQPIISKNPSIISKKLFHDAAKELSKRKPSNLDSKGERSNSLLTGILKCSYCNSNMIINTGKSG